MGTEDKLHENYEAEYGIERIILVEEQMMEERAVMQVAFHEIDNRKTLFSYGSTPKIKKLPRILEFVRRRKEKYSSTLPF